MTTNEPAAPADMSCCTTGYLDVGETTGTLGTLGGVNAYFARPAAPSEKALLICTDVFGFELINVRLIADIVCKETGFLVVVPDLFDGDALPVSLIDMMDEKPKSVWGSISRGARMFGSVFSMLPWITRHGDASIRPKLEAIVTDLRTTHGVKRLAAQGFCWGGRYSILLAGTDRVDVCINNHPSRVSFPADIEALAKPSFFVLAEVRHRAGTGGMGRVAQKRIGRGGPERGGERFTKNRAGKPTERHSLAHRRNGVAIH